MRFRRPTPATLIALLALFVALGGPAEAQKRVKGMFSGSQIKKETVTARQVKNGSLSRKELSTSTVNYLRRTPFGSIRRDSLAADVITGDKIADSSIGTAAVADKTLTANDIANGSLTQGVLAGDTVGNTELADNAVGKANMRVGSVGKSEMGKDSIGTEELINGVQNTTDFGAFTGRLKATFPVVGVGACAVSNDQTVEPIKAATPEKPAVDLTQTLIVPGQTSATPDNLVLTAKPVNATTLRFQACNLGSLQTAAGELEVPYVAFAMG